jgi:outer membrane protein TolC
MARRPFRPTAFRLTRLLLALSLAAAAPLARADTAVPPPDPPATSPGAVQIPGRLSFPQALELFHRISFDLLLADEAIRNAQAQLASAGGNPNPNLSLYFVPYINYDYRSSSCQNAGGSYAGCSPVSWGAQLNDNSLIIFNLTGKRQARMAVARAVVDAARLSRVDARRTLELQLKQAYLGVQLAQKSLEVLRTISATWTDMVNLNKVRFEKGAINEVDLAKVEVAKLSADQDVHNATQALLSSRAQVALLLGARGAVPVFDVDTLPDDFRIDAGDPGALLSEALQNRPDLRVLDAQIRRAQASIAQARKLRIPDISFGVQVDAPGYGQLAASPLDLGVNLQIPLPLVYRFQGEIRQAESDHRTQKLLRGKLEAQVQSDVTSALALLQGASQRWQVMEKGGLLSRARLARDLSKIRYEKGADRLLDFLDAQRTFISITLDRVKILGDCYGALYQLEAAVGRPFVAR